MMLLDHCEAVLAVQSPHALRLELVKFAQALGFNTVSATVGYDDPLGKTEFFCVHNTPEGFLASFQSRPRGAVDPVMQHSKHSGLPIVWDQSTFVRVGLGELWEEQAVFGYGTGLAMTLHLPQGRHLFLGVDRDQALPKQPKEREHMIADLATFLMYAQEVAFHVLPPEPRLTGTGLSASGALTLKPSGDLTRPLGQTKEVTEHGRLGCRAPHAELDFDPATIRAVTHWARRLSLLH